MNPDCRRCVKKCKNQQAIICLNYEPNWRVKQGIAKTKWREEHRNYPTEYLQKRKAKYLQSTLQ